jgi:TonB family protein
MLILNSRMFFLRTFVIFALTSSALGQSAAPYESELGTLADRLSHEIQLPRKHAPSPKVVVIDFPNQRGIANVLGERMSESLSDALAERLGPEHVVVQKQFRADLLSRGISPFDMQDNDVVLWNAQKAGANLIVLGHLRSSKTATTLIVQLVRASDGKEFSTASTDLTLTEEMQTLVDKLPDWRFDPDVAVPCFVTARDAVAALFKSAGVSEPKCIHCPPASYTDEARRAHQQGSVKFDAIIDEQGRISSATLVKGDSYGLAMQAMEVAKDWRFMPAMKNGKPVRVCSQIEMTFRLY